MADIFQNARLKIERANRHIDSMIKDSSPLSKDLYEIINGPARSVAPLAKPDGFHAAYRPKKPIVQHFGAIIGDTVNNLRESLDYWINTAIAAIGPKRKVYFPFSEERKNLETSPNYPAIKQSFPDLADFIGKKIQPCRDTNLHLWGATSLCNANKHNDFVPVVTLVEIAGINMRVGTHVFKDHAVRDDADRPIKMAWDGRPISIDENFRASVEITFPKGAIFENQPVIPTLTNMSQAVTQTLAALTTFVRPYLR
jgi:hypothetical protein